MEEKLDGHLFKKIPQKTMKTFKGVLFLRATAGGPVFSPALHNGLTLFDWLISQS